MSVCGYRRNNLECTLRAGHRGEHRSRQMAWFGPFEREEDMSEYSLRHEDEPHRKGGDRYAVYAVREGKRRRIAETNLSGIGCALDTLRAEGEFDERDRIGLFDRQTREWIVNPWA